MHRESPVKIKIKPRANPSKDGDAKP